MTSTSVEKKQEDLKSRRKGRESTVQPKSRRMKEKEREGQCLTASQPRYCHLSLSLMLMFASAALVGSY